MFFALHKHKVSIRNKIQQNPHLNITFFLLSSQKKDPIQTLSLLCHTCHTYQNFMFVCDVYIFQRDKVSQKGH
jgi:hypothetical protein